MQDYFLNNNTLIVRDACGINLKSSCFCGQAFRFEEHNNSFSCVIDGEYVLVTAFDDKFVLYPCRKGEENKYIHYFDLPRDYNAIEKNICRIRGLTECARVGSGIRVFNQEPFETLISFIISANNNISRITGIITRLCTLAGEKKLFSGVHNEYFDFEPIEYYTFPNAEAIARLSVSELTAIGCGYRAPYIKSTAEKIVKGFPLSELKDISYSEAKKVLMKLSGVGPKVADCVLLFSLEHKEAYPVDTWIRRATKSLFFDGKDFTDAQLKELTDSFGDYAGIVQQFIFFYAKNNKVFNKEE